MCGWEARLAEDEFEALIKQLDDEAKSARKRVADRVNEIKAEIDHGTPMRALELCDLLIADLTDGRTHEG